MLRLLRRRRAKVIIDNGEVIVTTTKRLSAKQRQVFIDTFYAAYYANRP